MPGNDVVVGFEVVVVPNMGEVSVTEAIESKSPHRTGSANISAAEPAIESPLRRSPSSSLPRHLLMSPLSWRRAQEDQHCDLELQPRSPARAVSLSPSQEAYVVIQQEDGSDGEESSSSSGASTGRSEHTGPAGR
eukprot:scaffold137226_cov49-Prasinocladus_malaysianus.AAC.1